MGKKTFITFFLNVLKNIQLKPKKPKKTQHPKWDFKLILGFLGLNPPPRFSLDIIGNWDMGDQDMGDRDMGDRDIGNWDISNWDIGVRGMGDWDMSLGNRFKWDMGVIFE